MKVYPNFYETLAEAQARLRGTVVTYNGDPVFVHAITDHIGDGIFRVYVTPIPLPDVDQSINNPTPQYVTQNAPQDYAGLGGLLDEWSAHKDHKDYPLLRKHINSPLFNKFRPFPLGMVNIDRYVYYLERTPIRPKMEQGLTGAGCLETKVTAGESKNSRPGYNGTVSLCSAEMHDCIKGLYPSAQECLAGLLMPNNTDEAAAFHRQFALVKGPLDTLYLAYMAEIIGLLPYGDFSALRLGRQYDYAREVIEELGLFSQIITR